MQPIPLAFSETFAALTGKPPFPWQTRLYNELVSGDFFGKGLSRPCNIPTGLGKTSVIAVWLIALANQPKAMPRRLVYVVNRRTVVDQTTDEVTKFQANLEKAGLASILKKLCALPLPKTDGVEASPLAISTLRGQKADNREWSADPFRPAVICGTVDMIGSRLLFGGYTLGFKSKPLHAGFLGQDSLLVHDEAHLEPAFQKLIDAIVIEQGREQSPFGEQLRMRVMELTATQRTSSDSSNNVDPKAFRLNEDDEQNETVSRRIHARKILRLVEIDDEKKLADKLVELAKQHDDARQRVVIFVRKVEDAEKIASKFPKDRTCKLTGTLRGLERDGLVEDKNFRFFLPESTDPEQTVYLVCTSAGEVGVNISADQLVCDLSTFESMAQRFGRVNRFGLIESANVEVVYPKSFGTKGKINDLDKRRMKTLALLRKLNGNASPNALGALSEKERIDAFSPDPQFLETSEILFDAWSLTSIRGKLPGRPPLEPYLHGITEWEPPQTKVAWRLEVEKITGYLLDQYKPEELLEDFPLKPHELLGDRSERVIKHLQKLAEKRPHDPVWVLDDDGTVTPLRLSQITDKENISGRTVLLAPSSGGLSGGFLDGSAEGGPELDVSEKERGPLKRKRIWDDLERVPTGMRMIRPRIDIKPNTDDEPEEDESPGQRIWKWYELPSVAETEGSLAAMTPIPRPHHTNQVVGNMRAIAARSILEQADQRLSVIAGEIHDFGKGRRVWQRSIGNFDESKRFEKSGKGMSTSELSKFRHEFGSLLDAKKHPTFAELSAQDQDLVLHLVATHHGRGRPHFASDESFDPDYSDAVAAEMAAQVPLRFAMLQRQYGRWGLAYLESLLRAADYAASANPSQEEAPQ